MLNAVSATVEPRHWDFFEFTDSSPNGRPDDLSERLALPVQYREAFGDALALILGK